MMFTTQEVIDYIELEWPEVTDAKHCASFVSNAESYQDLDMAICYYERHIGD